MKPARIESFGPGICRDCKAKAPLFKYRLEALCRDCHPLAGEIADAA